MFELFIFHLHLLAGLFAFTKYWQKNGLKYGFLAISVVALVFIVGWSISGMIANLIFPENIINSPYFTKNTFGLLLLIIPETVFFYHFFIKDSTVKIIESK